MEMSASPANHVWARSMVHQFVREFPNHRKDIEAEAILGLVIAEKHPDCPGPEQFQAFAYLFVWSQARDFASKIRTQQKRVQEKLEDAEYLLNGQYMDPPDEWATVRRQIASKLKEMQRKVFLAIYGEDAYHQMKDVAAELGLSIDQVRRLHAAVLEIARDLPYLARAA